MQSYFAYGSNLNVTQMARRCPDATDPRPATLADHDWLINERGVATVEPSAAPRCTASFGRSAITTWRSSTAPRAYPCATAATG